MEKYWQLGTAKKSIKSIESTYHHKVIPLNKFRFNFYRFFFRVMDTAWFEEKSDDEKLTYLSKLMYDHQVGAKAEFLCLLKLLPVQLVFLIFIKNSLLLDYALNMD